MKNSETPIINFTGKSIAKNTIYNLLGYGIPLIFAIIFIPPLIKGLGTEKFGILSLAWIVIGYFSFFDFGIGRALTKIVAEKIGTNQTNEIPSIFWTSFFLMLFISVLGMIILFFFTPSLVLKFITISKPLQSETLSTFYLLALSIPIVTTTTGLRGVLEAYQKFREINIIRTFLGIFMFLGPLLCLIFTNNLFWIVLFLILIRVFVWLFYFMQCLKLNLKIENKRYFEIKLIKPILKLSGWMTVSNIVVPLIVYLDRFLIGALVSAAAITYYATPYEAVTKLLLVPGALVGVLFPTFSSSYLSNPEYAKKLSFRAIKYIFIFLFPIILLIITFANQGMELWLGRNFAEKSSIILQLLAAGVLFNGIAYIPFTFLQGIGRPDITAKINLVELPFYFIAMWYAIKHSGINGAATVWLLRMVFDALILLLFAQKHISVKFKFKLKYFFIGTIIIASIFPFLINEISYKFLSISIILLAFSYVSWKFLLLEEERMFLISRMNIFNSKII